MWCSKILRHDLNDLQFLFERRAKKKYIYDIVGVYILIFFKEFIIILSEKCYLNLSYFYQRGL